MKIRSVDFDSLPSYQSSREVRAKGRRGAETPRELRGTDNRNRRTRKGK